MPAMTAKLDQYVLVFSQYYFSLFTVFCLICTQWHGTQNTAIGSSTRVCHVHINVVTCLKDKLDKLVHSAPQVLDT